MQDAPNSWVLEQTLLLGCSVVSSEIQGFIMLSDMCAKLSYISFFRNNTLHICIQITVSTVYLPICMELKGIV